MSLDRRHAALLAGGTALHACTLARAPEGWDGVGLLLSIERFDLASFRPHPPGYPVYVALLKAIAVLVGTPLAAAITLSCIAVAAATSSLGVLADRLFGERHALSVMALATAAPLVWRAATTVGTEAVALAFFAAAGALVACARPCGAGIALGLGLGVRLSWWPLAASALAMTPSALRRKFALGAAGASAVWSVALASVVGPKKLALLTLSHARGHFVDWGGGALTDPGLERCGLLLADVFAHGFGVGTSALGVLAAAALAACVPSLGALRPRARALLVAIVPYTGWILLAQNLRFEPRHAVPVVTIFAFALGLALADAPLRCAAVALSLGIAAFWDARRARGELPAGAQLASFVNASFRRGETLAYGGRAVRFLELERDAPEPVVRATMGDVVVDLAKRNVLPKHALVTDELSDIGRSPFALVPVARFCRPPRLDPRAPCVGLFEVRWPPELDPTARHEH